MSELLIANNRKQMRKNILSLGWPAILRLFLQSIVGVVDVIMIGRLGASAIASVDIGNRIVFVLIGSLMSLTIGATALVAHYVGAGNKKEANHIMWQSLLSGFLAASFVSIMGYIFSEEIISLMMILMEEADPYIINKGSLYLKIILISMIFGLPMMVINAILQGIGDMKTPLLIIGITNIINVIFNYLLIFGIGFFPALGVTGAALGTGLGRLVGFIIGLAVIIKGKSNIKLDFKHISWKLDWETIQNILQIGIPAAVEQFARQSSQIIYTALVAGLGTATIAANAVVMNVTSIIFMPGFGFGLAATTLVGQSLGAKKKKLAEEYGKQSAFLIISVMIIASIVMFIWVKPIVLLYTNDQNVVNMASSALRIFLFFQPFLGVFMVLAGALRGAGDTKWVMYFTFIGNWGVRFLFTLLFAFYLKLGLNGFWLAMGVDVIVRASLIVWRFLSGKWKNIEVIRNKEEIIEGVLD
jgi:putative MATE family efflux protein